MDLCFSEKWSKDAAKARAEPRDRTARNPLQQRGPQQGESRSALKTARKKIEPLKNSARLRFAQECWLPDTCAAMMTNERDVALFALAALLWYLCHACQPLAMHLSMSC